MSTDIENPLSQFARLLEPGCAGAPSQELTDRLAALYPWFALPAAIEMKRTPHMEPERRKELAARVALTAPDHDTLFRMIDPLGETFAGFYPAVSHDNTPTTDNAINTFLETYGNSDPAQDAILEKLIFHPVAEYAATLEAAEDEGARKPEPEPGSQDALLDAFLKDYAPKKPERQAPPTPQPRRKPSPTPPGDSPLAYSLARIYIARGKYDKAYEIIRRLSLNYPEKSIYFADQLRFLQKLMLNSQFSDK